MSTNTVLMQPQQTSVPYKGMPKNRWWRMVNSDVEVLKQLPEVLYASAAFWGGELHCSRSDRKGDYSLMGYSPDYQRINPQKILYGRFINDVDMQRKRKVCVIGTQVWKDLFPGGEDPAAGSSRSTTAISPSSASSASRVPPCRSATSSVRSSFPSRWPSRCSGAATSCT